jgi:DinB superfamily
VCHHIHMEFIDQDLSGARFARCLLTGAVIRGSDVTGMEIDDPHLHEGSLWVNGVDVVALVETELDRRFPGRELKTATTPDGLRAAWVAGEKAWAEVVPTASGLEDVSVEGEWSFSQTLRHLVMATNAWLHGAILGQEQPFHWIGQPFAEYEPEGGDMTIFREPASYPEVLAVRGEHQAMVRDYLATVTDEVLAETRPHPWAPEHRVKVLHCLHVILNEEWEHHRYAVRDLHKATGG